MTAPSPGGDHGRTCWCTDCLDAQPQTTMPRMTWPEPEPDWQGITEDREQARAERRAWREER